MFHFHNIFKNLSFQRRPKEMVKLWHGENLKIGTQKQDDLW